MAPGRKPSWVSAIVLNCLLFLATCVALQTHTGSAKTDVYALEIGTPDARITVDSSHKVIVINIHPPASTPPGQQPFKVGLELLNMELCDANDRLKIVYSHPVTFRFEEVIWKVNVTEAESQSQEVKSILANQIVLIPEGGWALSNANIVATLYLDTAADGTCPANFYRCSCPDKDSEEHINTQIAGSSKLIHQNSTRTSLPTPTERCIGAMLSCNGNPNCGLGCRSDEIGPQCEGQSFSSTLPPSSTICQPKPPVEEGTDPGDESSGSTPTKGFMSIGFLFTVAAILPIIYRKM